MNINRGPMKSAMRVAIYGTEGVGKTTFASKFPGVIFIDTEGSTTHMDVARFDTPESLDDVLDQLAYVLAHPVEFRTVVIDTVDWLERLIFKAVCDEKKIQNIEDIGYGKGYVYAKQKMQGVLEVLDNIIAAGIHVVLVCHSIIRKFELPDEMGSYDRYMLKLNEKNIAPLIKEWVDMLLFVNYKTDVVTDPDGKTKKGKGGQKRVMYANHSACWDAKNRFGLPDEMPFDFDQIEPLFRAEPKPATVKAVEKVPEVPKKPKKKDAAPAERPDYMKSDNPEKDQLLDQLWKLMIRDGVEDQTVVQAVVAEKEYYDLAVPIRDYDSEFIEGCLIGAWDTVCKLCLTKIHDLPF